LTLGLLFALVQRGRTLGAVQSLRELPSTTRAVLRIDTEALGRTAAAKTLFDTFVAEEQLSEIESVCGLDPLGTQREAVVWVRGPDDQPFQSIGLMLRGRRGEASTLAECHQSLVERREGSTVVLPGPTGSALPSEDRRSAIAVVDDRTILTGSVQTVAEAMAVRQGGAPSLLEHPRITRVWPRVNADASIALVLDPPSHWRSALERITQLGDGASALRGIETLGLSVKTGSAQTVEVLLNVTNAALAQENATLIRTWAASPPDSLEPPWSEVVRSMGVKVDADTIVVALDVSSLSRSP
jgi:hypothetical protein